MRPLLYLSHEKSALKRPYGVKFVLYDESKNPLGEYTTDQDGYIWIKDEFPEGKYFIRELQAAEGYVLDDQYKTVYIERGKTAQITWENVAVTGRSRSASTLPTAMKSPASRRVTR